MILRLTKSEMIERWLAMRGFGLMRNDATVTRTDGVDVALMAECEARRWFLNQLDTAPFSKLALKRLGGGEVAVTADASGSGTVLTLPPDVRRIAELTLRGRIMPVEIAEAGSAVALRQLNRLSRGGACRPVAVALAAGRLWLPGVKAGDVEVTGCLAIVDPGDDRYEFDESLFPEQI